MNGLFSVLFVLSFEVCFEQCIDLHKLNIFHEKVSIVRQMGHCMGGNFNIHIWAWSASPSVQVGR